MADGKPKPTFRKDCASRASVCVHVCIAPKYAYLLSAAVQPHKSASLACATPKPSRACLTSTGGADKPTPFLVEKLELTFVLDEEHSVVRSKLHFVPNPNSPSNGAPELSLDGATLQSSS